MYILGKFANIMSTDQSLFKNIGSTVSEPGNNFAAIVEPTFTMAMRIVGAGKQIGLMEPKVLGLAAALSPGPGGRFFHVKGPVQHGG